MIKILKDKEVPNSEIFSRAVPEVNVADIVLLARYVSQDTELQVDAVTAQGITNADVNLDAALTADDISGIGLYLSDMISLPIV